MRKALFILIALFGFHGVGEAGYTIHQSGILESGAASCPDAATRLYVVNGRLRGGSGTESNIDFTVYNGTFDKAAVSISANDVGSNSTATLQVNTADTAIVISITANTTGLFEDTSNTASVTAGQPVNWEVTVPSVSGSHAVVMKQFYVRFISATNTYQRLLSHADTSTSARINNATVKYCGFGGELEFSNTNEPDAQFTYRSNGTLRSLYANVHTNSGAAMDVRSRVAGGDGNMVLSIGSGSTGAFEDNVNTDTITAGNLVDFSAVRTSGTGNGDFWTVGVEFETTNNKSHMTTCAVDRAFVASTTYYLPLSGGELSLNTAEDNTAQYKSRFDGTATNLQIYLTANAATLFGTFDLRENGSSTALTVSVTALTTGLFEDTTNNSTFVTDDLLNYRFVVGAAGNSTVSLMGCMIEDTTAAAGSAVKTVDGLAEASVKTKNNLANASVKTFQGLA